MKLVIDDLHLKNKYEIWSLLAKAGFDFTEPIWFYPHNNGDNVVWVADKRCIVDATRADILSLVAALEAK